MVTEITDRDRAIARCAALVAERDGLDPTDASWLKTDEKLDAALADLYALGPNPDHPREEPWSGVPVPRDPPG